MKDTFNSFLDLVKQELKVNKKIEEDALLPIIAMGKQLGFKKPFIDLYIQFCLEERKDFASIQLSEERKSGEVDDIVASLEIAEKDKNDEESLQKGIVKKSLDKEGFQNPKSFLLPNIKSLKEGKTTYLVAYWNRYAKLLFDKEKCLSEGLCHVFSLNSVNDLRFYQAYVLFTERGEEYSELLSYGGLGFGRVDKLKRLLARVIEDAKSLNKLVVEYDVDSRLVDFLFKIDALTETNIELVKSVKISKEDGMGIDLPVFWMFKEFISSQFSGNDKIVAEYLLMDDDFDPKKIKPLVGLTYERIRQIKENVRGSLDTFLNRFYNIVTVNSTSLKIDLDNYKTKGLKSLNKAIVESMQKQSVDLNQSVAFALLVKFSNEFTGTLNLSEVYKSSDFSKRKVTKFYPVPKDELNLYNDFYKELSLLCEETGFRNLYKHPLERKLEGSRLLLDVLIKEIKEFEYRRSVDSTYVQYELEVDLNENWITRKDLKNTGAIELEELKKYLDSNYIKVTDNSQLAEVFSEEAGYQLVFDSSKVRLIKTLDYFAVANKWIKKDYLLEFVEESIFEYRKASFRDLIVEMMRKDPSLEGNNTSFWVEKLNELLNHDYTTNKIYAINKDKRVEKEGKLIFLKS